MRAESIWGRIDAEDGGVLQFHNRSHPIPSVLAEALLHELNRAINASARALDAIGEPWSHVLPPSSDSILALSSFDTGSIPISLIRRGFQYNRITA